MRLLFAVAVLSVCALVWVSFAIARHIRAGGRKAQPRESAENPGADLSLPVAALAENAVKVEQRKQPRRETMRSDRPDWAYFNEDFGDLTDPYERIGRHRGRSVRSGR